MDANPPLGVALHAIGGLAAASFYPVVAEFSLGKGMAVAIVCGVMSASMAYGFAAGKPIAATALRHGIPSLWQNLPVLIVILTGGFLTNVVWYVYLSMKNASGGYGNYLASVPSFSEISERTAP